MAKQDWHLDKKVPIGILILLCGNMIAGIVFVTKLVGNIDYLNDQVKTINSTLDIRAVAENNIYEQLATNKSDISVVKSEIVTVKDAVNRIDTNLDSIVKWLYENKNRK